MKNFSRFLTCAAAVAMMLSAASCGKDDNTTTKKPPVVDPPLENAAQFGETKLELKSVVFTEMTSQGEEYILIGATPDAGVATYEELIAYDEAANDYAHSFFSIVLKKTGFTNLSLDLKSTSEYYLITNVLGIADDLMQITNDISDEISAGSLKVKVEGAKMTIDGVFTLATGGELKIGFGVNYDPNAKPKNKLVVDGETIDIKSVVIDDKLQDGYAVICTSSVEGLDTFAKMTEQNEAQTGYKHPFMMIMIPTNDMENSELDLMTTSTVFNITNMSGYMSDVQTITTGSTEGVTAAALTLKNQNGLQKVKLNITSAAGVQMELQVAAEYKTGPVTSNYLSLDGAVKAVKGAYYALRNDGVEVYLTPVQVQSSMDLENVMSYYVMLYADYANMTGSDVNIATASQPFEFVFVKYEDETGNFETIRISNGNLGGATGTFSMAEKDEGKYAVKFNISLGGYQLKGDYDAVFDNYSSYLVDNSPAGVFRSAVVSKGTELTTVYLASDAYVNTVAQMMQKNPVILTIPTEQLGMGLSGFSTSPETSVTFDGNLYNQASESSGNAAVSLDGTLLSARFQLFNFGPEDPTPSVAGLFSGSCTVVNE